MSNLSIYRLVEFYVPLAVQDYAETLANPDYVKVVPDGDVDESVFVTPFGHLQESRCTGVYSAQEAYANACTKKKSRPSRVG